MLAIEEARAIAAEWRPRFQSEENFENSWSRFMEMVGDPSAVRLEDWLAKDLARDQLRHAGIVREPLLPVQQEAPVLDARTEAAYIARGDEHDWRNPELSALEHAAICPRCQMGKRSREVVDELARRNGKAPFPGIPRGVLSGLEAKR